MNRKNWGRSQVFIARERPFTRMSIIPFLLTVPWGLMRVGMRVRTVAVRLRLFLERLA